MLEEGVYLAPSAFEAGFMSLAHSQQDIERTIDAARRCFAKLLIGIALTNVLPPSGSTLP